MIYGNELNRHHIPIKSNRGFTLVEVMVTGVILMVFLLFSTSLIHQGVQQLEKRTQLIEIVNHIDKWSVLVRRKGFLSEDLKLGRHQLKVKGSNGNLYNLTWKVNLINPMMKGITFELQDLKKDKIIHQWKSGVLFHL